MAVVTKPAWTPSSWRSHPALHQPEWPSEERAEAARARLAVVPPLVFAGEARQLRAVARRGRRGPRVPAPGGRLRRVVPRPLGGPHPREAEDHAADGGRADVRRHAAGRQGRAHRRASSRSRARRRRREVGGGRDPVLPRPHGERRRARPPRRGSPTPTGWCRPTTTRPRRSTSLRAFTKGGFADLMRVHEWNQEFVASLAGGPPLRAARLRDRARAALHGRVRDRPLGASRSCTRWTSGRATRASCSTTRRRSRAATRTTGDWYDCSAHMLWIGERTRQPDGAHVEFFSGVHNPLGAQGRADGDARRDPRALRAAQPDAHPGPPDADRAHGRRARSTSCCRRSCGPCASPGQPVALGVRPDARERLHDRVRLQDAPLRRDHGRDRGLLRRVPQGARLAGRHPPRVHGRGRHRVPRRLRGRARGAARTSAT